MSRGEPLIRQWNLLKALQAVHYGLSAEDLAERLECSKRQVLRDADRDSGVYLEGAVFAKLVHHAQRCVVDFDGL